MLKASEIERVWRTEGYSAPPRRKKRNNGPPPTNKFHPAARFADAEAVRQFDQLLELSGSMCAPLRPLPRKPSAPQFAKMAVRFRALCSGQAPASSSAVASDLKMIRQRKQSDWCVPAAAGPPLHVQPSCRRVARRRRRRRRLLSAVRAPRPQAVGHERGPGATHSAAAERERPDMGLDQATQATGASQHLF